MFSRRAAPFRCTHLLNSFLKNATIFAFRGKDLCHSTVGLELSGKKSFSTTVAARYRPSGDLYRLKRNILTLDPTRLAELGQEVYDLSGLANVFFSVPTVLDPEIRGRKQGPLRYRFTSFEDGRAARNTPFPPSTEGFLYFHKGEPEIAGEVRFRICRRGEFDAGHDLMISQTSPHDDTPEPWNIPLYRIAASQGYQFLRALLIQEGLVDPTLMEDLEKLGIRTSLRKPLYALDQPFVVNLAIPNYQPTFVTRKGYTKALRQMWFHDRDRVLNPYSGKVKVRHVRSPLSQHINDPCLLLQYLEFLTPIRHEYPHYDRVKEPVIGNYLERKVNGVYQLWTMPLFRERKQGSLGDILDV